MARLLEPRGGAVLGVAVGALLTVLVAVTGIADHEDPVTRPEAGADFVDAWRRSRVSTYVAEGEFVREASGGRRLASAVRIVQRPPDRLVTGAGSVSGRIDGRRIACSTDEGGELVCREGGAVGPYGEAVEAEVAVVADAVRARRGAYTVTSEDTDGRRCYDLVRRPDAPPAAPAWGRRARFCFDTSTGAPAETVIRRPGSVDTTVMTRIEPEVTDGDLEVPG